MAMNITGKELLDWINSEAERLVAEAEEAGEQVDVKEVRLRLMSEHLESANPAKKQKQKKDKKPKPTMLSVGKLIADDFEDICYNQMSCEPTGSGKPITDETIITLRAYLENKYNVAVSSQLVMDAVMSVAITRPYHPVQDYLRNLAWDGVDRIGDLVGILGCEDSELNRTLLRRWMISAVARASKPGCQVDTMLVLVGEQGFKKSSFFRVMGGEHYVSAAIDVSNKDSFGVMNRSWLLEWAEMSGLGRRESNTVKAFITNPADTYRPSYGRTAQTVKRSSVIVGTVNPSEFLRDETGERRFWLVETGDIDLVKLSTIRDQLWAQAVSEYKSGARWWFDRSEDQQLKPVHDRHSYSDPWTESVLSYAEQILESQEQEFNKGVKITDIMHKLGIEESKRAPMEQRRVVEILKRAGWIVRKTTKYNLWTKPEPNPVDAEKVVF